MQCLAALPVRPSTVKQVTGEHFIFSGVGEPKGNDTKKSWLTHWNKGD